MANKRFNTTDTKHLTTAELWERTHSALCAGQWGAARAFLDDLGCREDNTHYLSSASHYSVPAIIHDIVQDRIDQVNAKVEQRDTPSETPDSKRGGQS